MDKELFDFEEHGSCGECAYHMDSQNGRYCVMSLLPALALNPPCDKWEKRK